MKQSIKAKLTSRKFWVAVVTLFAGILGMLGADDNLVQIITGGVLALVPTIVYIIAEGKIDAESVGAAVSTVGNTISEAAEYASKTNDEKTAAEGEKQLE